MGFRHLKEFPRSQNGYNSRLETSLSPVAHDYCDAGLLYAKLSPEPPPLRQTPQHLALPRARGSVTYRVDLTPSTRTYRSLNSRRTNYTTRTMDHGPRTTYRVLSIAYCILCIAYCVSRNAYCVSRIAYRIAYRVAYVASHVPRGKGNHASGRNSAALLRSDTARVYEKPSKRLSRCVSRASGKCNWGRGGGTKVTTPATSAYRLVVGHDLDLRLSVEPPVPNLEIPILQRHGKSGERR